VTNQLLAETEALPDLDEFSNVSTTDLASSIAAWTDGSEDQLRALTALAARAPRIDRPGIGHNKPPLAEMLETELEPHHRRKEELASVAAKAVIVDDESAEKVTNLVVMIQDLEEKLDKARLERSRPYRDAQSLINGSYNTLINALTIIRQGTEKNGGLRGLLTAWSRKKEEAAAAERNRLAAEEAAKRAEADRAQAEAAANAAQGKSTIDYELAALRARDQADAVAARAATVRAEPVRSHLGRVSTGRVIKHEIVDLPKWLTEYALKDAAMAKALLVWSNASLQARLKSVGIATVAEGIEIPGAKVWVERGQASVRR
jgi:hypothetical protein